jgi:hypothetical protein
MQDTVRRRKNGERIMINPLDRFLRLASPGVHVGIGFVVSIALVLPTGCRTTPSASPVERLPEISVDSVLEAPNPPPGPSPSLKEIEQKWGIQILGLRRSAGGYMLDFRYRVVDPEKAAGLFRRKDKPYLIDQASGRKVLVPNPPKVGPMRTSDPPKANRNYFTFFANPGGFIQPGNKVTIVIGDFRVEDMVVQ